jgi:hypothetical protein
MGAGKIIHWHRERRPQLLPRQIRPARTGEKVFRSTSDYEREGERKMIEEESLMLRTRPESVADKVKELRSIADKMMKQNALYCLDIHALAVDISEGLNLEE